MDDIIKVCERDTDYSVMGNWLMKPVNSSQVGFADDLVLLAKSEDLQHTRNLWNKEMERRNMKLIVNEIKTVVVSHEGIIVSSLQDKP
jgi:hypothetical protein